MSFPLAEWIERHADSPHNLGQSGMVGSLRSYDRSLRRLPPPDPERLRRTLARQVGVGHEAVFLTHGASEANALVLHHLAVALRRSLGRAPRLRTPLPEYPALRDTGGAAGFDVVGPADAADVFAMSSPRNPLGTAARPAEIDGFAEGTHAQLVDETFREFAGLRSIAGARAAGRWATGSFTKVFGADAIRVGFVVAPPEAVDPFRQYHGLVTDQVPPHSVASALALLRDRTTVLGEARGILRTNERALREQFPDASPLAAPLWFDRHPDGDRLARRALRAGVLVCPGSYFGDPNGVRIGLTRRSFPDDLAAYLAVRRHAGNDRTLPLVGGRARIP